MHATSREPDALKTGVGERGGMDPGAANRKRRRPKDGRAP